MPVPTDATLWTIGHSTRTWEAFLALLEENRIQLLADVRRFPLSAHVPWTNRATLAANLGKAGLGYEHLIDLGGYRKPLGHSTNTGWRNCAFRGYADFMETDTFESALLRLVTLAKAKRTAIMCAEAVPWRCHRSLLSDALVVRGLRVVHILSAGRTQDHELTPFARVRGGRITYPAPRGKA